MKSKVAASIKNAGKKLPDGAEILFYYHYEIYSTLSKKKDENGERKKVKVKIPRITVCLIVDIKTDHVYKGIAICSHKDVPNKKIGRHIAFGRALKAINLDYDYYDYPVNRNDAKYIVRNVSKKDIIDCKSLHTDIDNLYDLEISIIKKAVKARVDNAT